MGLFSVRGGGGDYYWREFCSSRLVRLIFQTDFASENVA